MFTAAWHHERASIGASRSPRRAERVTLKRHIEESEELRYVLECAPREVSRRESRRSAGRARAGTRMRCENARNRDKVTHEGGSVDDQEKRDQISDGIPKRSWCKSTFSYPRSEWMPVGGRPAAEEDEREVEPLRMEI